MANGGSYLRLTSRAEGLKVGENSQPKLDVSARAGFATSELKDSKRFLNWELALVKSAFDKNLYICI